MSRAAKHDLLAGNMFLREGKTPDEAVADLTGSVRTYWAQLIGAEFPSVEVLHAELRARVGLDGS